jgi:hypothetical protein
MRSVLYCCPILKRNLTCQQTLSELANVAVHQISRYYIGQMERPADMAKAIRAFLQLFLRISHNLHILLVGATQ